MRPLVLPGALSAAVLAPAVLVLAILATACSADPTVGADAPEAAQNRDVAVDPLPTATSTAAPTPTLAPAGETPTFDRRTDVDVNRDGTISEWPLVSLFDSLMPLPDIEAVNYRVAPVGDVTTTGNPDLAPIQTTSTTPDGRSIWVPIPSVPDAGFPASCGDGPGTRLGIESIVSPAPSTHAQPADELPHNISAIHHGPNNQVLFYTTCNGETRPAAFATVRADGNFDNVILVDPLLMATTFATPPTWHWGDPLPVEDYYSIGSLMVAVPQQGLVATGEEPGTTSQVYIDALTGQVIDVWASPFLWRRSIGYGLIESDGETVDLAGPIELLGNPIELIVTRQPAGPGAPAQALVGGIGGGTLLTPTIDGVEIERLDDRPVSAAAWAPIGPWLALSGVTAGTWLYHDDEIIQVSDLVAESLYFTPNGATLVIVATGQRQVVTFTPAAEPDDSAVVSSFSSFNSGGLGPIRVEALVSELRAELDMEFQMDGISGIEPGYCVWISSPQLPGVSMLGEAVSQTDAVITSIVVDSGPWTTPSGIRVGSAQSEVVDAFPNQLRDEPHVYIGGNYLTFEPSDPADIYSIKFETNGHQVIAMHAGRQDWISLVEGCA